MAKIRIEWLTDSRDCETCGVCYADGAQVFLDDVLFLDLTPRAHCFGGDNWDRDEVYNMMLSKLGHVVEISVT